MLPGLQIHVAAPQAVAPGMSKVVCAVPCKVRQHIAPCHLVPPPALRHAALLLQGIGRHSRAFVLARAEQEVAVLSTLLGDQPFLTGCRPSQADCYLFGLMEHVRRSDASRRL